MLFQNVDIRISESSHFITCTTIIQNEETYDKERYNKFYKPKIISYRLSDSIQEILTEKYQFKELIEHYNQEIIKIENKISKIFSKSAIDRLFKKFIKLKEEVYNILPTQIIKEEKIEQKLFETHLQFALKEPIRFSTGLLKGLGSTEKDLLQERQKERSQEYL